MLFKCLALDQPKLRIYNYNPGIVLTGMFRIDLLIAVSALSYLIYFKDMLKKAGEIMKEYQGERWIFFINIPLFK